jgi:hypothetical protein
MYVFVLNRPSSGVDPRGLATKVDPPAGSEPGEGGTTCTLDGLTYWFIERCAGDCVQKHEMQHVADMEPCCERMRLCVEKRLAQGGDGMECVTAYAAWQDNNMMWLDCRAYRVSADCWAALISGGTCPLPRHKEKRRHWWWPLRPRCNCCEEIKEARDKDRAKVTICDTVPPAELPCPFSEEGDIIK